MYHYIPAGLLCLMSLLGLVLPLDLSTIRIALLTLTLLLLSSIIRSTDAKRGQQTEIYHLNFSSVKSQLPLYIGPSFLEIYLCLLLMLVSMLFIQTFYLILR